MKPRPDIRALLPTSVSRRSFLIAILLVVAPLGCVFMCGRGLSQDVTVRDYDWTVDIETEQLKDYLTYPGSRFSPVVEARITYSQVSQPAPGTQKKQNVPYQDLFFRSCDPVGCRRYNTFDLPPGEGIAIRVKHRGPDITTAETCAAGNCITRVLLDAYLNGNMVIAAIVPSSSFASVVQELRRENFFAQAEAPVETPQYSSIILHLRSDPPGQSQTMAYAGLTTD